MLDYESLLFFAWLQGRTLPLDVYGAAPLQQITTSALQMNATPLSYYKDDMNLKLMP